MPYHPQMTEQVYFAMAAFPHCSMLFGSWCGWYAMVTVIVSQKPTGIYQLSNQSPSCPVTNSLLLNLHQNLHTPRRVCSPQLCSLFQKLHAHIFSRLKKIVNYLFAIFNLSLYCTSSFLYLHVCHDYPFHLNRQLASHQRSTWGMT